MATRKNAVDEQMKKNWKSLKAYAAGKADLKTTILSPIGGRTIFRENLTEAKERRKRLARFKTMRADLGLTQFQMAMALHVSENTLKGWEAGKSIPEVAFVLAEVLHDFPPVSRRLVTV